MDNISDKIIDVGLDDNGWPSDNISDKIIANLFGWIVTDRKKTL